MASQGEWVYSLLMSKIRVRKIHFDREMKNKRILIIFLIILFIGVVWILLGRIIVFRDSEVYVKKIHSINSELVESIDLNISLIDNESVEKIILIEDQNIKESFINAL